MSAYQQMGHDSENLLAEEHLGSFAGAVLSPVDYEEPRITEQIRTHKADTFEMVFDPQLYFPTSQRGKLTDWSYYPDDVDTANRDSLEWWEQLNEQIANACTRFLPGAVCSPAVVPRRFSSDYYVLNRRVAESLAAELEHENVTVLQTVIVDLSELGDSVHAPTIASVVTGGTRATDRCYLVLKAELHPRREIQDTEGLKGFMKLIALLEESGMRTLVSYSSSDMLLWKAAGATDIATGKFWNLRRFTPSRWQPPAGGGGQVSYWFEEAAMAFLRDSDLERVRRRGLLSELNNPWGQQILRKIDTRPGEPWLGDSWRQFMYWFADFESRFSAGTIDADTTLRNAERVWDSFEDERILMEERANDGSWLRPWRRAVVEYDRS